MFFLSILLTILKIAGIVILVLLGILILLLCLLLFVPIRYRVHAEFHGKINVTAHVTYLLRLLHIQFSLEGTESDLQIHLFGRSISGQKEKAAPAKDKKAKKPEKKQVVTVASGKAEPKEAVKAVGTKTKEAVKREVKPEPKQEAKQEPKREPAKPVEKKPDIENNKKEKNKNTNTKTGDIINNIKTVTNLLKENKKVLKFIFGQIKLLFRHVLPGSYVINIRLGLDDPAMLGEILGAVAVVRASTGLIINITPVWNETIFEADADLKGRIILGRVLFIAARVYFNKDVKKLINAVRK